MKSAQVPGSQPGSRSGAPEIRSNPPENRSIAGTRRRAARTRRKTARTRWRTARTRQAAARTQEPAGKPLERAGDRSATSRVSTGNQEHRNAAAGRRSGEGSYQSNAKGRTRLVCKKVFIVIDRRLCQPRVTTQSSLTRLYNTTGIYTDSETETCSSLVGSPPSPLARWPGSQKGSWSENSSSQISAGSQVRRSALAEPGAGRGNPGAGPDPVRRTRSR